MSLLAVDFLFFLPSLFVSLQIGQAAVPLNMCILGINLSSSFQSTAAKEVVSSSTVLAVVVGKLIVMPVIGILTTLVLKKYLWTMADGTSVCEIFKEEGACAYELCTLYFEGISSSLYLVLMVVTITPTANNVIVMLELSGSSIKVKLNQGEVLKVLPDTSSFYLFKTLGSHG
jgi:predicted permease